MDEPAVQGDVPVQDESQQPLALSATSSSKDYIRSSDNNDNKGAALVLLPLQHGQQVLRLSSRASLDRLYNWASIPYPLSQRAVHAAFERILLWSPGSNSAAQAPAATAMTTALIPLSSGPVPASRCFFSIIPDPAPTVSRTANVFTTHLHGMGPADGDHCVTEMMTTEALQGMLVVPSHQHYQQEQPPASYHTVSNALVRYDKAYATTKAAVAPFAKSPASFKDISTFMSHMGLAGLCFLKVRMFAGRVCPIPKRMTYSYFVRRFLYWSLYTESPAQCHTNGDPEVRRRVILTRNSTQPVLAVLW